MNNKQYQKLQTILNEPPAYWPSIPDILDTLQSLKHICSQDLKRPELSPHLAKIIKMPPSVACTTARATLLDWTLDLYTYATEKKLLEQ